MRASPASEETGLSMFEIPKGESDQEPCDRREDATERSKPPRRRWRTLGADERAEPASDPAFVLEVSNA
jgi:hypothetical protein